MDDEKKPKSQEELIENGEQEDLTPTAQVTPVPAPEDEKLPESSPGDEKLKAEAEKLRLEGIKAHAETQKINTERTQLEQYLLTTKSFWHSFIIAFMAAVVALAAAVGAFIIGQRQVEINNADQKLREKQAIANQAIANASPANSNVSLANSIETAGAQIANALGIVDLGVPTGGASAATDQRLTITGIPSDVNIKGIPPNINITGIPTSIPKEEGENGTTLPLTKQKVFNPDIFIQTFLINNSNGQITFNDALKKYTAAKEALDVVTNDPIATKNTKKVQGLERSVYVALADLLFVMIGFNDDSRWKSDVFNILNTKLYERGLSSNACFVNSGLLVAAHKSLPLLNQVQLDSMKDQAEKFIEVCKSQPPLPGTEDEDNLRKIELLLAKIRVELLAPFKNLG